MKSIIKKLIHFSLLKNDKMWRLTQATLIRTAGYLTHQRALMEGAETDDRIKTLALQHIGLMVRNGPFKGMKYPDFSAIESRLLPKLLGSYENEIQTWIEDICRIGFSEIINIGCGEGYYAVGLALRNPHAKIFAYDTDKQARDLCKRMAVLNNVEDRVIVSDHCSINTIKSFRFKGRTFILSDCKGYEKDLFKPEVLVNLKDCDLLIELHDYMDITISSYIQDLFRDTHQQLFIQSIDDIQKAKTYDYKELTGLDIKTRHLILAEKRPAIMEWVYLKARASYAQ